MTSTHEADSVTPYREDKIIEVSLLADPPTFRFGLRSLIFGTNILGITSAACVWTKGWLLVVIFVIGSAVPALLALFFGIVYAYEKRTGKSFGAKSYTPN